MPAPGPAQVLTVTEITRRIKGVLEDSFSAVWIEGEISNLRTPGSGHSYFTLKDAGAQINAVLFRGAALHVNFKLKDGLQVLLLGDISVYEKSGQYQIICRQVLPKGLGALQLAFEDLKRRLQAEGLFDPARKKPIPTLPQRIGLVTSPTGAAIRDFLNIIGRRYPNVHIIVNPVRVQGVGAGAEIAAAIDQFNTLDCVDVIIVTRGGGSLEDLWAFNEEVVARALARSRIPTISAVGHEIDFTIADFVADLRAPTPSAAAELVAKAKQEFERQLAQYGRHLDQTLRLNVSAARQRFTELATSYVFRQPAELIRQYQQQLDDFHHRLTRSSAALLTERQARIKMLAEKFKILTPQTMIANWQERVQTEQRHLAAATAGHLQKAQHRLATARTKLDLLSPRSTLERGYSITRRADGSLVKTARSVATGDKLTTLVADGEITSVVGAA